MIARFCQDLLTQFEKHLDRINSAMTGKVAWKEGLALLPQHFQQAEESARADVCQSFGKPPSRGFGFTRLQLDTTQLSTYNTVDVKSCAGFFQGGIRFDSQLGKPASLRREIHKELESFEPLTVFVAMRVPSRNTPNLGAESSPYEEYSEVLPDSVTGRSSRPVGLMSPALTIRLSSENNEGFLLLPVWELVRGRQGAPVAKEDFFPTVLDIHAASGLVQSLQSLSSQIRNRCAELERQNPPVDAVGLRLWLEVLHLRSNLPGVEFFLQTREIHPEQVFVHLLQLAGGLATTRGTEAPKAAYDHHAMSSSLGRLFTVLFQILASEIKTDNLVLAMTRPQPLLFVAKPTDQTWNKGTRFFLALRSSISAQQLVPLMAQKAKVSPMSRLQPIIMSALGGIEARLVPPPGFFRATGQICFELSASGPLWQTLVEEGVLGVYTPADLEITSIELLVEGG